MSTSAFRIQLTDKNTHFLTSQPVCFYLFFNFFSKVRQALHVLICLSVCADWNISYPKVTNIIPTQTERPKSLNLSLLSLRLNPVQKLWRLQPLKNIALSLSKATGKIFIFSRLLHACKHTRMSSWRPLKWLTFIYHLLNRNQQLFPARFHATKTTVTTRKSHFKKDKIWHIHIILHL